MEQIWVCDSSDARIEKQLRSVVTNRRCDVTAIRNAGTYDKHLVQPSTLTSTRGCEERDAQQKEDSKVIYLGVNLPSNMI